MVNPSIEINHPLTHSQLTIANRSKQAADFALNSDRTLFV
ncbi:hypothetical protein HMPREF9996_00604 [Aggregatibacter actinomycetemcomitans Y4]|nr:hypothetical protein HMPREF9996_00604 [Aggregatibacter actinomycetemcomitans Y4]